MKWKSVWMEVRPLLFPIAVCAWALFAHQRAWQLGYAHPEVGLMGCLMAGAFALGLAWLSVYLKFRKAVRKEISAGLHVGDLLVGFLAMLGCIGCYPLWPVALCVMALYVLALTSRTAGLEPRKVRQAGLTCALFLLTWFECASLYPEALQGFAERLDKRVGEVRIMAWAEEVIAARKRRKDAADGDPFLAREEIPEFAHDLMGGRPDKTRVEVRLWSGDSCVTIASTANHAFRVTIHTSRRPHEDGPPACWFSPGLTGLQWRPGIFLDTVGNFR
jgi:hypothetical protein